MSFKVTKQVPWDQPSEGSTSPLNEDKTRSPPARGGPHPSAWLHVPRLLEPYKYSKAWAPHETGHDAYSSCCRTAVKLPSLFLLEAWNVWTLTATIQHDWWTHLLGRACWYTPPFAHPGFLPQLVMHPILSQWIRWNAPLLSCKAVLSALLSPGTWDALS